VYTNKITKKTENYSGVSDSYRQFFTQEILHIIDVKNVFTFFILITFLRFLTFFIFTTFL